MAIVLTVYLSAAAIIAICLYTLMMFITTPLEYALTSLVFVALSLFRHWPKLMGIRADTARRAGLSTKFWSRIHGGK